MRQRMLSIIEKYKITKPDYFLDRFSCLKSCHVFFKSRFRIRRRIENEINLVMKYGLRIIEENGFDLVQYTYIVTKEEVVERRYRDDRLCKSNIKILCLRHDKFDFFYNMIFAETRIPHKAYPNPCLNLILYTKWPERNSNQTWIRLLTKLRNRVCCKKLSTFFEPKILQFKI